MKEDRPSFYAIIPANVRYNKNLTANAKLLYGEITALCNAKGYCWARNEYFAELYNVSTISISNWIASLIKEDFISAQYSYRWNDELKKMTKSRQLFIVKTVDTNDDKDDIENKRVKENFKTNGNRVKENFKYNNIDNINNTEIVTQSYYSSNNNLDVTITPSEEGDTMTSYEGLVKEEKKTLQSKKKPSLLSTQSYKLIEKIIKDKDLFFNHRLPTEKNNYKITATIKRAVEYIDLLSKGLFEKKIPFTEDYLKKYNKENPVPNIPLIYSETEDLILYAIDQWKLYLSIGYRPDNKEGLKKVSIDQWFYNSHTGFSWFLECLNKPAQEIKLYTAEKLLDDVPREFANTFLRLYNHFSFTDDEKSQFYRYIYLLFKRWEKMDDIYDGILTRPGYISYMGNPNTFAKTLMNFLIEYPHWENWRLLKPDGALWRDFRRRCLKDYNVDINPNKEWLDKAIEEEKETKARQEMYARNQAIKEKADKEKAYLEELEKMF